MRLSWLAMVSRSTAELLHRCANRGGRSNNSRSWHFTESTLDGQRQDHVHQ